MKGEYQEEIQDHHHHHTNNTNMFYYKLQQQQTQTFHHQTQNQPQPTFHHPFHIAAATSEEADSRSPTNTTSSTPKTTTSNKKQSSLNNPSSQDGATIEVIRRPRGRPPGSKNKAKPPIIITKEPEPSMSPYVLELPPNVDIIESVFHFCHKLNISLCIFNGSGSVTNVTLHQPSSTPGATVTFHGRFDILSISATILPTNESVDNSAWPSSFTITLGGPQGQVFGGVVVGPLASAGTIYLIAATFNNPTYQRLPFDDENNNEARNNEVVISDGGGGNEGQRHHSASGVSGGGGSEDNQMAGMYSNFQSDVIWAPIARPPPPY